jgi:hypothetical protein
MSSPQAPVATERAARQEGRSRTTLAAFLVGLPLAGAVLCLIHFGPLSTTVAVRYVSHPVEYVEVVMFCGALGALGAKLWSCRTERRACEMPIVPPWNGQTVAVSEAGKLRAGLLSLPRAVRQTWVVHRATAVLDFLCHRGSAAELDDHLRSLSDTDALALEGSYALTRFITWAVPILGFLGTVLGITSAISGVTPDVLEKDLSKVTDGLALAFDATALALGLTMVTMFVSFIVERAEQGVLDQVDQFAERELAHRFERTGAAGGEFVEVVRRNTDVLLQAMNRLVEQQTALWAQALEEADRRRKAAEHNQLELITDALATALEQTLEMHSRRLATMEKQTVEHVGEFMGRLAGLAATVRDTGKEHQAVLAQVAQGVAAQVEALAHLQDSEKDLRQLQETLNQNLATLAGAGTFEQALHSLTAAIHLLTARSAANPSAANRLGPRSGAAA